MFPRLVFGSNLKHNTLCKGVQLVNHFKVSITLVGYKSINGFDMLSNNIEALFKLLVPHLSQSFVLLFALSELFFVNLELAFFQIMVLLLVPVERENLHIWICALFHRFQFSQLLVDFTPVVSNLSDLLCGGRVRDCKAC